MREEIRNKNLEDINVLRITLEGKIEELERRFENAHMNYLQNTDKRTQDFKCVVRPLPPSCSFVRSFRACIRWVVRFSRSCGVCVCVCVLSLIHI